MGRASCWIFSRGPRTWFLLAGLVAGALSCAPARPPVALPSPTASGQHVIKIATHSPLSGNQSVLGLAIRNGSHLAVEQRSGRVTASGFTVQLVPFDDRGNRDASIANASTRLVTDPDILLVIGHLTSEVAIPASEVYRKHDLAMISPASSDPLLTDRGYQNVTRVVGRDDVQGQVAAEFARRDLKIASAYILHDRTAYTERVAGAFRDHAEKLGIRVLGFAGMEAADVGPILTAIQSRRPEVIYLSVPYREAGVFAREARAKGITSMFLGPDWMDVPDLARIAGGAIVGMHYTAVAGPPSFYPGVEQFIQNYRKRFGDAPPPYALQAYDATAVGLEAIANAISASGGKKPSRLQVTSEVRRIRDFKGLTGTFTFDGKGDPVQATYFVIQIVSRDPARWSQRTLVRTLTANPPPAK